MPPKEPEKPNAPKATASRKQAEATESHIHAIELADLIVHRYAAQDALMRKAHKVARALIDSELREGEAMRVPKPGSYIILLPKLTREAGALRCAVIAEQVAREVRKLIPSSVALDQERSDAEMRAHVARRRDGSIAVHKITTPDDAEQTMKDNANRAFTRMAQSAAGDTLALSEADRATLAGIDVVFHPVWHTKNNLITAYNCVPARDGRDLTRSDIAQLLESGASEATNAKIDAMVYDRAVKAMQVLINQGLKAVLIVPIHFSTVDRLRFLTTLLEPGSNMPELAKSLMVFELIDLPAKMSRFRLREPANHLRTRVRALIARAGFEATELEQFKEFGFHGVSANVGDYDWKESLFLKSFERLAELAEKNKLQSFVHGISSTSLAVGAVSAGFTYMDGDAIAEPVRNPSRIRPFEIDMLYEG